MRFTRHHMSPLELLVAAGLLVAILLAASWLFRLFS
jgi:hypothetical protein